MPSWPWNIAELVHMASAWGHLTKYALHASATKWRQRCQCTWLPLACRSDHQGVRDMHADPIRSGKHCRSWINAYGTLENYLRELEVDLLLGHVGRPTRHRGHCSFAGLGHPATLHASDADCSPGTLRYTPALGSARSTRQRTTASPMAAGSTPNRSNTCAGKGGLAASRPQHHSLATVILTRIAGPGMLSQLYREEGGWYIS